MIEQCNACRTLKVCKRKQEEEEDERQERFLALSTNKAAQETGGARQQLAALPAAQRAEQRAKQRAEQRAAL